MVYERILTLYLKELNKRLDDVIWHGGNMGWGQFDKTTIDALRKERTKLEERIKNRED